MHSEPLQRPPEVLGLGELKRRLFYSTSDKTDVFYVVADDYHDYPQVVTSPRVKYRPLSEPLPDKAMVKRILMDIHEDLDLGKTVAVACAAGVNRSATIACVAHMAMTGKTFLMAMRDVRLQRPQASPFYWTARTVLDVAFELGLVSEHQDREIEPITGKQTDYENRLEHHA